MTAAAHIHPHPSEFSSVFGWCQCQSHPNIPALFQQCKRNRYTCILHLLVFHHHSIYELRGAENQVWWKVLFCYAVVTLMVLHMQCFVRDTFWSFNAVPLLRHHTRCLISVQKRTNKWLKPKFPLSTVLYCKSFLFFFICKLEWSPRITSCVHCPPLPAPAFYPSLILETNDQLYLFLLLPGNSISRWALPSPTMQCCKSL